MEESFGLRQLKLAVVGLSESEIGLIHTLFRLYQVEPAFIWVLSAEHPVDAILADVGVKVTAWGKLMGPHTKVMWLGDMHAAKHETLMPRPIRSDILLEWLDRVEIELAHTQFGAKVQDDTNSHWGNRTVKLKRWPPIAMLKNDKMRIRIATLLSRRGLSVHELSELTHTTLCTCISFLQELEAEDLLLDVPSIKMGRPNDSADLPAIRSATAPSAPWTPMREFAPTAPLADLPVGHTEPSPTGQQGQQFPVLSSSAVAPISGFGLALIRSIRRRFGIS